jgi:hypothetical protein
MAKNEPPAESELAVARKARDEAQLVVGQIHGIVSLAVNEVDHWLEPSGTAQSNEPEINAEDIRRAGAEVHSHFGTVHAALNTGSYDGELVRVGLTGAQREVKRKGFLSALRRYCSGSLESVRDVVATLRPSLRWSKSLIESITAALKKEVERTRDRRQVFTFAVRS